MFQERQKMSNGVNKKIIILIIVLVIIIGGVWWYLSEGKTCLEQGGNICSSDECSGSWIEASDTDRCCSGGCQIATPSAIDYQNSPFGIHDPVIPQVDSVEDLVEVGAKWVRYAGPNGLVWDIIEPEKGRFDWTRYDELYLDTHKAGIKMFVSTLAVSRTYDTEHGRLPRDWEAYKEFLRKAVERYDGDGIDDAPGSPVVDVWQIENEVDWTWKDSPEDYALLLKESYITIKEANPKAKVAVAGVSMPLKLYYHQAILKELHSLNQNERYFDIFDFHWFPFTGQYNLYSEPLHTEVVPFKEYMRDVKKLLSDNGYSNTPIFITETAQYTGVPSPPEGFGLLPKI